MEVIDLNPCQEIGLCLSEVAERSVSRIQSIHLSVFWFICAWDNDGQGIGSKQWP